MSTSTPIIVSNEPQKLYFPSSTRSKIIHRDSRMAQKAYDFDVCGKMARSYGCSRHDTIEPLKRIPETCKQRFTKCCFPRIHKNRMEKHDDIIDMMRSLKPGDWEDEFPTEISWISIRKPVILADGKRDGEGALTIGKLVKDTLKRLAREGKYKPDAQTDNYFVKVALQGFIGNDAIYRAIYWGPHYAPSTIRSAILKAVRPDAQVEVTTEPNGHSEALFSELFNMIVPDDEAEQAELEIMFHTKDLVFYSQRLDQEAINDYGSFPCTEPQGNELEADFQNCDDCSLEIAPTCPKCGKQADMISETHPMRATPEEITRGKWEKLFKPKRKA